jgi:hypothetical protein
VSDLTDRSDPTDPSDRTRRQALLANFLIDRRRCYR